MLKLKFSSDYYKLPKGWVGTKAILIAAVYCNNIEKLKHSLPKFITYDTVYRGREGSYELNFKEGLVLVFIHIETGKPFTTIRRYTPKKKEYYDDHVWHCFELVGF